LLILLTKLQARQEWVILLFNCKLWATGSWPHIWFSRDEGIKLIKGSSSCFKCKLLATVHSM